MSSINVAVVGVGYWGPNLVRNLLAIPDCKLVMVCDKSSGRRRYIEEKFPQVRTCADLDGMLANSSVDALFIATPVPTHYPVAIAALKAGKHVFVEKPLAATSEEAARMVDLADAKQLTLAVGHLFAYHPAITTMKAIADRGDIARLCYAESSRINLGPPASQMDVIWDLAVHDIAILVYLLGAYPTEVVAHGNRLVHSTLVDVAFLRLQFANGFFSQHHVSWLSPDKVRRFSLFGSGGSLTFDDTVSTGKLRYVDKGVDTRINLKDDEVKELSYRPGRIEFPELPAAEPLQLECKHFLDCVRNNWTPRTDGRAGLAVVRTIECSLRSIASGSRAIPVEMSFAAHVSD